MSSLLRAAIPSARSSFDARARRRGTKMSLRLWGCVYETGRTARPASAWAAAAMEEGKDDELCAFLDARATTYLVIILITA